MDDNENYITINDQGIAEISPTASSDMQNAFIDTYRNMQAENTAQIGDQTHALGSDLEAPYGGLHGPSEYMKSRYQTPQTESRLAGLRTAAQLSALNQLMQNDASTWNERYKKAYKDAQERARQRALAAQTQPQSPTNNGGDGGTKKNLVDEFNVHDSIGIGSGDWSSQNLPAGANRITRVGTGGFENGYPTYIDTADNTDGSMGSGTTVGGYGVPVYTDTFSSAIKSITNPFTAAIKAIGGW